jgi:hypothetical protein
MDESITDLEALYNVEATFEYTGRNGLAQAIRSFVDGRTFPGHVGLDDCTVLVTRFPPALFEEDFDEVDNPPVPSKSKNLYFPDSEILILTMKGPIHELVARSVHDILTEKMRKMNCLDELLPTGGKTVQLRGFSKEPDESWGPSINECPTCVLEVAVSESLRQLNRDAERWIKNELSHATQVITTKIYTYRHEIIFAIWRKTARGEAEKVAEASIELQDGRPLLRPRIQFRLSFEELLKRPPRRGSAEKDIIFTARDLGGVSRRVWHGMGLIPRG